MKYLFFAMLLLASTALLAQSGNYFLSHYAPNNKAFDNVCFDIAQDHRGVFYYASQTGVMEFDGRNWDFIQGVGSVYSLETSSTENIYWAGSKGFGKLAHDNQGRTTFQKLSDDKTENVFQILNIKDQIYFLTEQVVFILHEPTSTITHVQATNFTGLFTGIFDLQETSYLSTERGEIYKIEKDKLTRAALGLTPGSEVILSTHLNTTYAVVTNNNQVLLFEGTQKARELNLKDKAYTSANVIIAATWVNAQLIALGTLRGGVLFVNTLTGDTQEIVNYNTGLPDNEVFALATDHNQNIWVAHDYGFTRIAPYLPLRSFSHYPGLQGNILCATSFQSDVYVGTSLGLFKLEREEQYEELVYYVEVTEPVKTSKKSETEALPPDKNTQEQPVKETTKRGLFRFLKKKRNTTDVSNQEPAAKDVKTNKNKPSTKKKTTTQRAKRTVRVLRSSQYVYKKIPGIEAKVTQLTELNDQLVATGLAGVHLVNGLESKVILEQPVRFTFASKKLGILLTATYDGEVRALKFVENKSWRLLKTFDNIDDQINFIFEGKENEIWLCALDKVYKLELLNEEIKDIQAIIIPHRNSQDVVGVQWQNDIVIASAEGFYRFDRSANTFTKIDSLADPRVYFTSQESLWFRDEHQWHTVGRTAGQSNLQLLNLFYDLRFIASDVTADNLWLVSGNNELFKFFGEKIKPYEQGYDLFVRAVKSGDSQLDHTTKLKIEQNNSVLSFAVIQPDYVSPQAVEYRYFLKGLHQEWTDWAVSNNSLDFPYLPEGKYTLQVQAKNIFGKVTDMQPIAFEILPPYWKRSWFYALEFVIFASLVVLSFRLSNQYRIVSRLLSLLTIILLIEFIQTVIGATFSAKDSPVSDFFIQVVVALLILPVEGYLRNLMLRSIDSSKKWYHLNDPNPEEVKGKDQ